MKKIIFIVSVVVSIFIINNLVQSIYGLWNKQDLLVKAQKDLENQKKENEKMKKQITVVYSQEFVEKEARDKLFMVKKGESQVIIQEDLLKASSSARDKKEDNLPNWRKWLNLFF
ncbi:MAG: septum formation initiator family protein [Candidatus Levybacteria bacterium]|nr:septum formation initiator family protein [Candidatus Levybacteria bacterium]